MNRTTFLNRVARFALAAALLPIVAMSATAQKNGALLRKSAPPDAVVKTLYADHFAHQQNIDKSFRRNRARFAPELRRLLDKSFQAQKANPDEIVGLDFNPLTNAQEEALGFEVGAPIYQQTEAVVPVAVRFGPEPTTIRIHLVLLEGRWLVSNISYDESDLVTILKSAAN